MPNNVPTLIQPFSSVPECKTGRFIYVDKSRTDKYSNPNGSEQRPYRTVQEAIDASPEYEFTDLEDLQMNVIYVMPGIYIEDLTITRPIALVGANMMTCLIEGTIISDTTYLNINNLTFWELTLSNVTLFKLMDCYLNTFTATNSVGQLNNCEIKTFIANNSRLELFNNCKFLTAFEIYEDASEPRPGASRIQLQDSKLVSAVAMAFEILNGGEIVIQASHSLVLASLTMIADMTVTNYNSTFLDLDKTLGTYNNYAGYPTAI